MDNPISIWSKSFTDLSATGPFLSGASTPSACTSVVPSTGARRGDLAPDAP